MKVNKKRALRFSLLIAFSIFLLAGAVIYSIIKIQTFEKEKYEVFVEENIIDYKEVPAERGNLYASDGTLLAMTTYSYNISLDMTVPKKELFNTKIDSLSLLLGKYFKKPKKYFKNKFVQARKKKKQYILLAKNIDTEEYKKLKSFPIFRKGRYIGGFIEEIISKRDVVLAEFGDRLVGYDDNRGKAGLEGAYSVYLRGEKGYKKMQRIKRDVYKPLPGNEDVESKNGSDVYTTFDLHIQDAAYNGLLSSLERTQAEHGSAIVMEVTTGKVRAMVNLTRTKNGYKDTRNWGVYEAVEPGSTFKLISLMAALEDNKVDTATVIDVGNGVKKIYERTIRDDHSGLGNISVTDVLVHSSNVGTVSIIYNNYKDNPKAYVNRLYQWGLSDKLGIEIQGEGSPMIPYPGEENWSGITLPWMAWGYGLKLTPLQMLTFYNAVANNGEMVKPQFIEKIQNERYEKKFEKEVLNPSICSQETISKAKKMLEEVVKRGTAKNIYTPEFSMAGKTGTTQVEYWKGKRKTQYNASFVGYFPTDNPKYSCMIVVNKPKKEGNNIYGGSTAAPVFKEIARRVFINTPQKYDSSKKKNKLLEKITKKSDFKMESIPKRIPNFYNLNAGEALALAENCGLKVNLVGIGKIVNQSITKGATIIKGATITLKANL